MAFSFPPLEKTTSNVRHPPAIPQSPFSFNHAPSVNFCFSPFFSPNHSQTNTPPPPPVLSEAPPSAVSETPDKHAFTCSGSISPEETANPVVSLELMVEKKSKRVVFAESNEDFVDILLSFLTLPIGSIVKMTKEMHPPTSIGCMKNIHKSVEHLEAKFFKTEACKEMLILPRRSFKAESSNLKIKIGENSKASKCFYFCPDSNCRRVTLRLSEFPNVHCYCGQLMSQLAKETIYGEAHGDMEGVFIERVTDMFLISDDLQVMTGSTSPSLSLLKKSGITDANELETQSFTVGSDEVLQLLRLTLLSQAPLTDWIRTKQGDSTNMAELHQENTILSKSLEKTSNTSVSKQITLKLFRSKLKEKVLYAECGEDFVDFLFSFLTIPLGSIVQLFEGSSSILGIDNLYKSVNDLDSEGYFKSEELKNMLIKPKLAPFHACENGFFNLEETSFPLYELHCLDSKTEWSVCPITTTKSEPSDSLGAELGQFMVMNPKYSNGQFSSGGGLVKGPAKFMVTDGLDVMQISAISSISILAKLNVPISDVEATVITMSIKEALSLLKAALVSETPLSDVFNSTCD